MPIPKPGSACIILSMAPESSEAASSLPLYAGIEAGGTKWVVALGTDPDDIRAHTSLATGAPSETLGAATQFLRAATRVHGPPAALGVACFGPIDLKPDSPTWGHITSTPKPGWADTDVAGELGRALNLPVGFDTDVAGAALGEARWGAGQDVDTLVYVTVGTGIGGAILIDGRPVSGLVHPEMGHIRIPRHPDDPFVGGCPFHGDCLEGLAAGPAIQARWGRPAHELPADHPAWNVEAFYLGAFAANLTLTLSPERLIFGGGVSQAPGLLSKVRRELLRCLSGYVQSSRITEDVDAYLVAPRLGPLAGVGGAFELARAVASRD